MGGKCGQNMEKRTMRSSGGAGAAPGRRIGGGMHRPEYFLWNAAVPFAEAGEPAAAEHFLEQSDGIDRLTDVSRPTLTFFPVSGGGTHPAVMVCPGGGYELLAWNHEGIDICGWLNSIGFAAFLLKYRCPNRRKAAHADAARAMRFIRFHADAFRIRPEQLGCLGFSAGAHLTASIAAPAEPAPYAPSDEMDRMPFRPDYTLLIYPAFLCGDDLALQPEFRIGSGTPPAFLVQTEDDPIRVENALGWFLALKQASIPAELHLFADGGHGYGILRNGHPVSEWPQLASGWLRRQTNLP